MFKKHEMEVIAFDSVDVFADIGSMSDVEGGGWLPEIPVNGGASTVADN